MSATPEAIQTQLASEDFGDRLQALNQLRDLDGAIAFEMILPLVEDVHPRVRYAAVSQLASLGQHDLARAYTVLKGRLVDSEMDVQAAAADALGALSIPQAFDDLKALYERSSEWVVQFSIIAALGTLGDPRAFELLEDALQSDNELMHTVAIGSLGELGGDRAFQLVAPFVNNPDWQIRFRVVQALRLIATPDARPLLEKLVDDDVDAIAQEAKTALSQY